jgi:hypothetical protein
MILGDLITHIDIRPKTFLVRLGVNDLCDILMYIKYIFEFIISIFKNINMT